jgi:alcohol dehydrogenase class IV
VIDGKDFRTALCEVVAPDARVLIVASRSLLEGTAFAQAVTEALSPREVVIIGGIIGHTPREDVVRVASAARRLRADVLVACGGGSVIDAVKAVRLCLANDIETAEEMSRLLPPQGSDGTLLTPAVKAPQIASIAIPTTLSAAEHTMSAGVTDTRTLHKNLFFHPMLAAGVVILDGELARSTPVDVWLATGLRSVDHAVETWCSVRATALSDACSCHALRLLLPALRRAKAAPDDAQARLRALRGAWLSILSLTRGAAFGASHGIGHALGSVTGMAHGHTSAVMLPHVLAFNAAVNAERQRELVSIAGLHGESLATIVADLVRELGLPSRLRDAGVSEDSLAYVAKVAMQDRWLKTNPRKLEGVEVVRNLLSRAF